MKVTSTEHTVPLTIEGHVKDIVMDKEIEYWYPWIADLKGLDCYLSLWAQWKPNGNGQVTWPDPPPTGHEYYIISGDSMFGLAQHFAKFVNGKVIQLILPITTNDFDTEQITCLPYNDFHLRVNLLKKHAINKNITHKVSALTNRLSHSKIVVFTALMEHLGMEDCLVSLCPAGISKFTLNEMFPNRELVNHEVCDRYLRIFYDQWLGKSLSLPSDNKNHLSYDNVAYQNVALNFTQETHNNSFVFKNGHSYIEPGPYLTEKTTKCIMSQTAFIPVGQMHSYQWLRSLGLRFDYGDLDLGFDNDPGNLTRLEKIIGLIKSLQQYTAQDLYQMTLDSTRHNYEHVQTQEFWQANETYNQKFYNYIKTIK